MATERRVTLVTDPVYEPAPLPLDLAEDPIASAEGIARNKVIAPHGLSIPPAALDALPALH